MRTPPTNTPPPATVLSHPAFDRPPVRNDRRPGPKKGCLSFAKAVRNRVWLADQAERSAHAAAAGGRPHNPDLAHAAANDWEKPREEHAPAPPTPQAGGRERHELAVIDAALAIIEAGLRKPGALFDSPQRVKDYMRLHLAQLDHEVFGLMYLDVRMQLLAFEIPFRGTLTHTSVHPREVVKRALQLGAAAVVLAHNHPSGCAVPSRADEVLTATLRAALGLVDVRVIDHVVVGVSSTASFAELGIL